jgi:hypothetical protein
LYTKEAFLSRIFLIFANLAFYRQKTRKSRLLGQTAFLHHTEGLIYFQ